MRAAWALGLATGLGSALAAAGPVDPEVVDLRVRPALLLVVNAPTPELSARVFDAFRRGAERLTGVAVVSPAEAGFDPAQLTACAAERRFSCWTTAVRSDYRREVFELPGGEVVRFAEVEAALRRPDQVHYLAVVGLGGEGAGAQLTSVLVHTDAALRFLHEEPRANPDWAAAVEAKIFDWAIRTHAGGVDLGADGALDRAALAALRVFGETLPIRADVEDLAEIAVEAAPGSVVFVDGVEVGRVVGDRLRLVGLSAGSVVVELDLAGARERHVVELLPGARALVAAGRSADRESSLHAVSLFGGIAVALAGAAVLTFAAVADAPYDAYRPCLAGACEPKVGLGFVSSGDLGAKTGLDEGGGVLLAPLGYGLVLAGGSAVLGSRFASDELAWLPAAIGVVLGGAAYGLSAALSP